MRIILWHDSPDCFCPFIACYFVHAVLLPVDWHFLSHTSFVYLVSPHSCPSYSNGVKTASACWRRSHLLYPSILCGIFDVSPMYQNYRPNNSCPKLILVLVATCVYACMLCGNTVIPVLNSSISSFFYCSAQI